MEPLNPKIIAIVLRHYFCNIGHLVSDEDILKYYFTLSSYVKDDNDISWSEIGSDYTIWYPFEHTNPYDVIENMESLYDDIQKNLNLLSPNITINPLEVASQLAEDVVIDYFTDELGENFEYTDDNGETKYNEDAQEVFNEHYDYFITVLNNNAL